jgi:hypothetical protein
MANWKCSQQGKRLPFFVLYFTQNRHRPCELPAEMAISFTEGRKCNHLVDHQRLGCIPAQGEVLVSLQFVAVRYGSLTVLTRSCSINRPPIDKLLQLIYIPRLPGQKPF